MSFFLVPIWSGECHCPAVKGQRSVPAYQKRGSRRDRRAWQVGPVHCPCETTRSGGPPECEQSGWLAGCHRQQNHWISKHFVASVNP